MRKSIIALTLLGAVLSIASTSVPADAASRRASGPVRFVDHNGNDRGYLFCKKAGMDIFDCNYFTREQCDVARSPNSRLSCVVSPWAIEQGWDPFYGTPPAAPGRRQVQRQPY